MKQKVSLIARDLELLVHEYSEASFTQDSCDEEGQKNCEKAQ